MQGDYQSLIDKFGDMDIEVLNIETFSISYEKSKHYDDWYQIYAIVPWATTLAPVKDLTLFPKLRKFVAAQEAFSLVDEELAMCRLPHSIAETRIIKPRRNHDVFTSPRSPTHHALDEISFGRSFRARIPAW
jgi:hypothetical protein